MIREDLYTVLTLAIYCSLRSMFLAARSLWMKTFLERYSIASAISWQNLSSVSDNFVCAVRDLIGQSEKRGIAINLPSGYRLYTWYASFIVYWYSIYIPVIHQVIAKISSRKVFHDQHNLHIIVWKLHEVLLY